MLKRPLSGNLFKMILQNSLRLFIFIALGFLLLSCASPSHRAVERINIGMEKSDVLDILGSPTRTERARNGDRWTYESYTKENKYSFNVYFHDGRVSHITSPEKLSLTGSKSPPPTTKDDGFVDIE